MISLSEGITLAQLEKAIAIDPHTMYIVQFVSRSCPACQQQKAKIDQLMKSGLPIQFIEAPIEYENNIQFLRQHQIRMVPSTAVFYRWQSDLRAGPQDMAYFRGFFIERKICGICTMGRYSKEKQKVYCKKYRTETYPTDSC